VAKRRRGEIGLFAGTTQNGKTYQVKKRIRSDRRVCVWSVKEVNDKYAENWPDSIIVKGGLHELRRVLIDEIGTGSGRVIYIPRSLREFGAWSKICFAWGIMKECTVVGEELADVTTPAKAPEGWGNMLRQGVGFGMKIYGVSQRPAEADKTILGNVSFIQCHFLSRSGDRKYMAEEMDVAPEDIKNLNQYHWVRRVAGGKLQRGK